MKIHILLLTLMPLFCELSAQSLSEVQETEFSERIASIYSVPSIPALEFIASDPSNISRPSNVKKFIAGLYNGIDETGKVKQGLAIEAKIAEFLPITISPEQYRTNQLRYILYNSQLSLGSIATSGDSTSTDLGWGLRFTIFDNSDPMRNRGYIEEFENVMRSCIPEVYPIPDSNSDSTQYECINRQERPVRDSFADQQWNASWMTIAYAGGSRLKGSMIPNSNIIGHRIWLCGGAPISSWGQFSYILKWSEDYNNEMIVKFQELEIGGMFLVGNKSLNFILGASYNPLLNKADFELNNMVVKNKYLTWNIGIEFKISDGIWANAGIGEQANRIFGNDGVQLLSGIRMGISDKSRIRR